MARPGEAHAGPVLQESLNGQEPVQGRIGPGVASSLKKIWSSTTADARSQAALSMKSERYFPTSLAARSIRSRCSGDVLRLIVK